MKKDIAALGIFVLFMLSCSGVSACGQHSCLAIEETPPPSFAINQVPEAISGFQFPIDNPFSNNGGWEFADHAGYPDYQNPTYYVYHPGEDWNRPNVGGGCGTGCNSDMCLPVRAAATGKVVYTNPDSWGGIVVQHNYQRQTWYTQYGHVININIAVGDEVVKGQKIAEIGNTGAGCAHLHFEIREADHPNPTLGPFWELGETGIGNKSNVDNWYESPNDFIREHPAYSICTAPTAVQNTANNLGANTIRLNCAVSARKRTFQYRLVDAPAWIELAATTDTFINISGLLLGATYQWQSTRECSDNYWSEWSAIETFTVQAKSRHPPIKE